jgi:hypothetical protein
VLLLEERDKSDGSQTKRTVVSAGMDGILMIWNLSVQQQVSPDLVGNTREDDENPVKELTAAKPPLRKSFPAVSSLDSNDRIAPILQHQHLYASTLQPYSVSCLDYL